jgi:DNA-binding NarL/FixJ family response regulator
MQNPQQDWRSLLTPREREIAHLVARGLGNKEIARALGTAPGTVRFQVHCLLRKLRVATRGEIAARIHS